MLRRGVDATPPPGALRASFAPAAEPSPREAGIEKPREAALLIIDAQNYNCTRAGALWNAPKSRSGAEELSYFFSRLQGGGGGEGGSGGGGGCSGNDNDDSEPGVIRNWVSLAAAARSAGARVIFTVMSDATGEANPADRVTSLDYRLSGFQIPPRSWDARLVDELLAVEGGEEKATPSPSDLLLPKTSCNVFLSTALDFHLRSVRTKQLIVAGVVSDQCVSTAVQTAADLGFLVTLVEDACAATSPERHEGALRTLRGFARMRSTREVVAELLAAEEGGS